VLAARVRAAGRSGSLVQLYITAPPIFSEKTKAPYGAGHCNFSDEQRIGLITVLDKWVRQSAYPVQAGIAPDLGAGYDPLYVPGPWPGDEPS
jgi:hypothetical protein